MPVIGTWTHWALFGGEFPGTEIIPRLYIIHVLLLPGHPARADRRARRAGVVPEAHPVPRPGAHREQRHRRADPPGVRGQGRRASSPSASACIGLMGGLFQINPIWNLGPYNPAHVSAGSQPDFYMGWSDGMARLFPAWEIVLGQLPDPGGVLGHRGVPAADLRRGRASTRRSNGKMTKDNALHNLLQRPRDVPVRTSLGVMAIAFYVVLLVSSANDWFAFYFDISLNATTWMGRIGLLHRSRRSPTGWPTGSASACSAPTGPCSSTASRPASSSGCRTASSSRCTSRWPGSTTTVTPSRWSTRARRCRGR